MVLSTSNDVKEKINIHWFDSDPNWKIFWICFVINCFFFNHSRKNYADEAIQNTLFWSKIDALCSSYVVSNDTNITCEWGHNLDKNPEIKRNHQQKHRSTGEPTTHSKLLEQTPESESLDILEMHIQCVNWSRKQISASPTGMEAQEMVRWVGRFYGRWKERISYFTWSQCVCCCHYSCIFRWTEYERITKLCLKPDDVCGPLVWLALVHCLARAAPAHYYHI